MHDLQTFLTGGVDRADRVLFGTGKSSEAATFFKIVLYSGLLLLTFLLGMMVSARVDSGVVTLGVYLVWSVCALFVWGACLRRLKGLGGN